MRAGGSGGVKEDARVRVSVRVVLIAFSVVSFSVVCVKHS